MHEVHQPGDPPRTTRSTPENCPPRGWKTGSVQQGRLGWAGQALPSGYQRPRPPRLVHTPGRLRGPCQGPLGHDLPAWSAGWARRDAAFSGALPVCCAQRLGGCGLRGGRHGPGGCNTHMHQDLPTGSRHGSSTSHHHLSPGHLRKKWKIKKLL